MRRVSVALLPLAIGACVPAEAPTQLDRLSVFSWEPFSLEQHSWRIDRDGSAQVQESEREGGRTIRFTIARVDFDAIRASFDPLERRKGKPLDDGRRCTTDQGARQIGWSYGKHKVELMVDKGCTDGLYAIAAGAENAAYRKLRALAATAADRKVLAE